VERLVTLGAADAGEVLTLQRAAYVTEAQLHEDLSLPALRQSLSELSVELDRSEVLAIGWRAQNGRLLAAVRATVRTDDARAEIGRLAVVPDGQGQGLGTRLLSALEARLPAGVSELRLFTGERSEANLRLYRRLGYVETHRTATPAGYALVHLSKPRAPASELSG
jgi:ribosomal protein S18 acetylase RimI-like enzyme